MFCAFVPGEHVNCLFYGCRYVGLSRGRHPCKFLQQGAEIVSRSDFAPDFLAERNHPHPVFFLQGFVGKRYARFFSLHQPFRPSCFRRHQARILCFFFPCFFSQRQPGLIFQSGSALFLRQASGFFLPQCPCSGLLRTA